MVMERTLPDQVALILRGREDLENLDQRIEALKQEMPCDARAKLSLETHAKSKQLSALMGEREKMYKGLLDLADKVNEKFHPQQVRDAFQQAALGGAWREQFAQQEQARLSMLSTFNLRNNDMTREVFARGGR